MGSDLVERLRALDIDQQPNWLGNDDVVNQWMDDADAALAEAANCIEADAARIAELDAALSAATARAEAAWRTIRETHKRAVRHADCDREYCHICDGGLFQCADCGAIEADAELRVCTAEKAAREAAEAKAARLEEALVAQRAFILHWTDDVNGGLKPTLGSLRSALDAVSAALEA